LVLQPRDKHSKKGREKERKNREGVLLKFPYGGENKKSAFGYG